MLYKNAKFWKSIELPEGGERVLSTFLFSESKLSVLSTGQSGIVAHTVNLADGSVEVTLESDVKAVTVNKTANYYALIDEQGETHYLKPSDLSEVAKALVSQHSAADDLIVDGASIINLADN